jgi:hypothetical protein
MIGLIVCTELFSPQNALLAAYLLAVGPRSYYVHWPSCRTVLKPFLPTETDICMPHPPNIIAANDRLRALKRHLQKSYHLNSHGFTPGESLIICVRADDYVERRSRVTLALRDENVQSYAEGMYDAARAQYHLLEKCYRPFCRNIFRSPGLCRSGNGD